jgi:hypothetical protein
MSGHQKYGKLVEAMRLVLVILGVASALACPYECAGKWASAQTMTSDQTLRCCKQCEPRGDEMPADNHVPRAPAPNEDGHWCLCEGAVFGSAARPIVDGSDRDSVWIGGSGSSETIGIAGPTLGIDDAAKLPLPGGKQLRIMIHSLLL